MAAEFETEDLKDIVLKITGSINPVGETNEDNKRYENLIVLCALVDRLVCEIEDVAYKNKASLSFAKNRAGEYAYEFLKKPLGFTG